jgi:MFS superfamily sulfate permease-like transporter
VDCAVIAVPLLDGSIVQVSGPTAAFVVIVAPIVIEHGLSGLIITTIMAGILLIILGLAKLGRYINYVPYPVTTGFTSGIAVVIGTLVPAVLFDRPGRHDRNVIIARGAVDHLRIAPYRKPVWVRQELRGIIRRNAKRYVGK